MEQTNVRLPSGLKREAKVWAAMLDESLRQFIQTAMEQRLQALAKQWEYGPPGGSDAQED